MQEKLYTVHLLNGGKDRFPKFVGKISYLEFKTTAKKRREIERLRATVRNRKRPTKRVYKEVRDAIEQGFLRGELSYDDSPRVRAKVVTDIIGYEYYVLASLVTRIAIILEEDS